MITSLYGKAFEVNWRTVKKQDEAGKGKVQKHEARRNVNFQKKEAR